MESSDNCLLSAGKYIGAVVTLNEGHSVAWAEELPVVTLNEGHSVAWAEELKVTTHLVIWRARHLRVWSSNNWEEGLQYPLLIIEGVDIEQD